MANLLSLLKSRLEPGLIPLSFRSLIPNPSLLSSLSPVFRLNLFAIALNFFRFFSDVPATTQLVTWLDSSFDRFLGFEKCYID